MSEADIHPDSEEEYEARRQELMQDAAETKQALEEDQQEILESIQEEHGGDLIETPVTIAGDHTATIKTKLDGNLMDTVGHIDKRLEKLEDGNGRAYESGEAADDAAQLLDDIIAESEYNKDLFYGVYQTEGLDALGAVVETVFDAISEERKRMAGATEGFRKASKD